MPTCSQIKYHTSLYYSANLWQSAAPLQLGTVGDLQLHPASGGLICLLVYTASAWHLVYFLPSKWMHAPMGPRDPNLPFYVSTTNFCLDLPPQMQQAALTSTRACWALPLPGNLSCMHKGAHDHHKCSLSYAKQAESSEYLGTSSELGWSIIHSWKNWVCKGSSV